MAFTPAPTALFNGPSRDDFVVCRQWRLTWWKGLIALFVWLLTAELSRHFRFGGFEMSLVWPPDGIALGLVLVYGLRMLLPLALAVVCWHVYLGSEWQTVLIGVGAFATALSVASLLGQWFARIASGLRPVPQVVIFQTMTTLPAATLLALLGGWQFVLSASGQTGSQSADILLVMFLSELFGALLFSRLTMLVADGLEGNAPIEEAQSEVWQAAWWVSVGAVILFTLLGRNAEFELLGSSPRYLLLVLVAWAAYQGRPLFVHGVTALCGMALLMLAPAPLEGMGLSKWILDQALLVISVSVVAYVVSAAQSHQNHIEESLRQAVNRDGLTGMLSERGLLVELANRKEQTVLLGLDILNLDHFESLGGIEGARDVEANVAKVLVDTVPEVSFWARARDGWFVGLTSTLVSQGDIDQTVRQALEGRRFKLEGRMVRLRVAIGWLQPERSNLEPSEQLSLLALSCQIQADRTQNAPLPGDLSGLIQTRRLQLTRVEALRDALQEKHATRGPGLWLAMQSIQAAHVDQQDLGFEVLLRWRDADGRESSPGEFLPLAERYGLMPQVDRWVISNVCQLLADAGVDPATLGKVSINLSGMSMSDPGLADYILNNIRTSGLPATSFCFEVTESSGIAERSAAIDMLHRLRNVGVKTALDDFGTGLATFDYLKSLPLDYVKIDGSFVRNLHTNRTDQRIVESVCTVARTLGLYTVAEFVETQEQRSLLAAYGVDQVQGYGIAKPIPLSSFLDQLETPKKSQGQIQK